MNVIPHTVPNDRLRIRRMNEFGAGVVDHQKTPVHVRNGNTHRCLFEQQAVALFAILQQHVPRRDFLFQFLLRLLESPLPLLDAGEQSVQTGCQPPDFVLAELVGAQAILMSFRYCVE